MSANPNSNPDLSAKGPATADEKFLERLDKAIVFRSRSEDPQGIANAVLCALFEVRNAYAESRGLPRAGELITPATPDPK